MTAESAREKIRALIEKRGFAEQRMKKDLFILDTGANKVGVDLLEKPIVGVFINSILEEQGHGVEAVYSLRTQVMTIWENNRILPDGSEVNPTPKPEPEKHKTTGKDIDEKLKEKEMKKMEEKAVVIKEPDMPLNIEVIKQYICPTATDTEAFNFLQLCHYRGLNPFLKEAYLIKYGTGAASMVVGKDAFTRKAEESPAFDGYEAGIVLVSEGKFEDRIGTILKPKEELVGGWARVYRKNTTKPFEVRVSLTEYDKKMNNWKSMPATMIRKVALVQALREAFTKELGGCYDAAELDPNADVKA